MTKTLTPTLEHRYDSRCFDGLAKIRALTKDVFSGKGGVVSSQPDTSVEKEQLDAARKVIEKLNKKVDDMRESLEKKEKEVVIPPETLNKLKNTEEKLKQAQEEIERLKKSGGSSAGTTTKTTKVRDLPRFKKYTQMLKLHMVRVCVCVSSSSLVIITFYLHTHEHTASACYSSQTENGRIFQ